MGMLMCMSECVHVPKFVCVCVSTSLHGGFLQGGAGQLGTARKDVHCQWSDGCAATHAGNSVSARHLVINQPISGQGLHCCHLPISWRDLRLTDKQKGMRVNVLYFLPCSSKTDWKRDSCAQLFKCFDGELCH